MEDRCLCGVTDRGDEMECASEVKCSTNGEKMKIMIQVIDILSMRDKCSLVWQDGEDQDPSWL